MNDVGVHEFGPDRDELLLGRGKAVLNAAFPIPEAVIRVYCECLYYVGRGARPYTLFMNSEVWVRCRPECMVL